MVIHQRRAILIRWGYIRLMWSFGHLVFIILQLRKNKHGRNSTCISSVCCGVCCSISVAWNNSRDQRKAYRMHNSFVTTNIIQYIEVKVEVPNQCFCLLIILAIMCCGQDTMMIFVWECCDTDLSNQGSKYLQAISIPADIQSLVQKHDIVTFKQSFVIP